MSNSDVRYVTQDDWNAAQDALATVLRVADHMPAGHHRESIRNIIATVKAPPPLDTSPVNLTQEISSALNGGGA